MASTQLSGTEAAVEWLRWNQALRLVRAAGVSLMPWIELAQWCGDELVETKAATITGGGSLLHEERIAPVIWKQVASRSGAYIDPASGSISFKYNDPEDAERVRSFNVMGPQFRKDQLLAVVAHVDPEKIQEALSEEGPWLGSGRKEMPVASEPPARSPRGRKPERERWQAFYFAVIELAKDDRLTADHFNSVAALSAEIEHIMGKGAAFDPDYVKAIVGQIHRRFCSG